MEYNLDVNGKRILGYNLENAEDFLKEAAATLSSSELAELADHNSVTSNKVYTAYIRKYPNTMVGDRDLMLHESRFKYAAAELANVPDSCSES
jgi:hypothetical protein